MKTKHVDREIKLLLAGRYRIVLTHNDTGATREYEFDNALLDAGLERLCTVDQPFTQIKVPIGTSNAAVANNQVGLQGTVTTPTNNATVNTNTDTANTTSAPYWRESTYVQTFQTGISGTFREVGFVHAPSNVYLSRALIADSSGTPIDLVVSASETLTIYYTFRVYCPTSDVTGTITMGGTATNNHNFVSRPANFGKLPITSYATWSPSSLLGSGIGYIASAQLSAYATTSVLGAINSEPSGSAFANVSVQGGTLTASSPAYVAGSLYREHTYTVSPVYMNHANGIAFLLLTLYAYQYQVAYTPPIMKTSYDQLVLRFRFSIARY